MKYTFCTMLFRPLKDVRKEGVAMYVDRCDDMRLVHFDVEADSEEDAREKASEIAKTMTWDWPE